MNNLRLLIGRKPVFYDVSDHIVQVTSSGARGKAPRDLKVTLLDSEQFSQINTNPGDGLLCTFLVDGKEFFRGSSGLSSETFSPSNQEFPLYLWFR